jgi:hypothetical protein
LGALFTKRETHSISIPDTEKNPNYSKTAILDKVAWYLLYVFQGIAMRLSMSHQGAHTMDAKSTRLPLSNASELVQKYENFCAERLPEFRYGEAWIDLESHPPMLQWTPKVPEISENFCRAQFFLGRQSDGHSI